MLEHAGRKETLHLEVGEIILVDKPLDWTSFDIVHRVRAMFEVKKIGHAGTLDPKATGLLILCTGKMTKQIDSFMGWEKEYTGIIELGAVTKSFDTETEVIERKDVAGITEDGMKQAFQRFTGVQQQLPPMYSAIKKNGRRLYKDARKGKEIERATREVEVKEFVVTSFSLPFVGFRVVCSKGTYVRSLANDVGAFLGCGGYLKELRRTRIGGFRVEEALPVELLHTLEPKIQRPAVTV
ncbi:MAG: tRNA pseudouridine(55) synthase TruB [Bacteroidetes bacterium]|nr:tRNA pseudouridine(55) synthase TruB [Bacteroidota bacterium]